MPLPSQKLAQQIRDLPAEKRIIFVHPNFKAQHLLLNEVMDHALYLRIQGQNLDESQLQQQLDAEAERQAQKGGGNIHYVVLDEGDRVQPSALIHFFRDFLGDINHERIVILSRVLPNGFLENAELRSRSTFIPVDERVMLSDYTQVGDKTLLEVRAFGEGRVHLNGRIVDSWDGALPRALFFYLIDRGMVTRAEIFQTFWPTLSTREATNVFHVTKRKISEVLGTELTIYGSSFYHISPKIELLYDVSLFNQWVQDSENEDSGDFLRQALSLYRGDYLMSMKSDWVLSRRDSLQQASCDALISLGRICENKGLANEALDYYLRAARLKPEREDAAFAVMRLYSDLHMSKEALQIYQRLTRTLRDTLNVTPSPQLQQFAARLDRS